MKTREESEVTRNASGASPPAWKRALLMLTKAWVMLTRLLAILIHPAWQQRLASATPSARERIYEALRDAGAGGATFEEVARGSGLNTNTVRGRLSELAAEGVAVASDHRREVSSGRGAVVYLANDGGAGSARVTACGTR